LGQRLGQHFLVRQSTLERIAREACDPGEPLVIEIGPGRGALTRYLMERAERLIAIELDGAMEAGLREKFPTLELLIGDVLTTDLTQWGGPVAVVGNLPYYITSPILEKTLDLGPLLKHAVFLIQKEVAERLMSPPGCRDYGYLTVRTQLLGEVRRVVNVPPGAFLPPPKVDSTVVKLTPRTTPLVDDTHGFLKFAAAAFAQKRKNLRNNLQALFPAIAEYEAEGRLRAEQLSLTELIALWRMLVGGDAPPPGAPGP
jgi:16S rRNA (adenine1518-N6/adenine1519-N6)-dimethyltransferase